MKVFEFIRLLQQAAPLDYEIGFQPIGMEVFPVAIDNNDPIDISDELKAVIINPLMKD